ncbi:hypothetical protein BAUCODRAFT_39035 [Baudoinia panamericana UAMH 10762]|uniref:Uncharacterized protein n=1 Tax=Baudoinia panamericana (strain UAMH 10762) TaxID=717646 RepID=M2MZY7_BAUPA|nr:uncharacterized protein BAUCODRAFT_39035 [Baudoinia panamericana UAMH 10762]EMC91890.1 hypothetical protein BAUCODRAFT_39035 [Baudoinia panamericana UAMH 10762]
MPWKTVVRSHPSLESEICLRTIRLRLQVVKLQAGTCLVLDDLPSCPHTRDTAEAIASSFNAYRGCIEHVVGPSAARVPPLLRRGKFCGALHPLLVEAHRYANQPPRTAPQRVPAQYRITESTAAGFVDPLQEEDAANPAATGT